MSSLVQVVKKPSFWIAASAWSAGGYFLARYFASERKGMSAISKSEFQPLTLKSKESVSHDTCIFRFQFPSPNDYLDMTVASCLAVKADCEVKDRDTGETSIKPVIRPYTPVSDAKQKGYLDLIIKRYEYGAMSRHLFNMKVGDTLLFKGPFEKIVYQPNKWNHIGMLAGGTGLTPMLQVIKESISDPDDKTKFTLILANKTPEDILMKSELDSLVKQHPEKLKISYTVDNPPKDWNGATGFISENILKDNGLDEPKEGNLMLVCGPPGFMKSMSGDKLPDKSQGEVDPNSLLGKLGFSKDNVYKF